MEENKIESTPKKGFSLRGMFFDEPTEVLQPAVNTPTQQLAVNH